LWQWTVLNNISSNDVTIVQAFIQERKHIKDLFDTTNQHDTLMRN